MSRDPRDSRDSSLDDATLRRLLAVGRDGESDSAESFGKYQLGRGDRARRHGASSTRRSTRASDVASRSRRFTRPRSSHRRCVSGSCEKPRQSPSCRTPTSRRSTMRPRTGSRCNSCAASHSTSEPFRRLSSRPACFATPHVPCTTRTNTGSSTAISSRAICSYRTVTCSSWTSASPRNSVTSAGRLASTWSALPRSCRPNRPKDVRATSTLGATSTHSVRRSTHASRVDRRSTATRSSTCWTECAPKTHLAFRRHRGTSRRSRARPCRRTPIGATKRPRRSETTSERWLAGEAIHARPPSPLYLAQRFLTRHRVTVRAIAIAAVLFVAIGGAIALTEQRRRKAMQDALSVSNRVGQLLADAEDHGQGRDADRRRQQLADAEQLCHALLGRANVPQAHYLLGRVLRRAGPRRFTDALAAFDAALGQDPGFEEARFERGLLLAEFGDETFDDARALGRGRYLDQGTLRPVDHARTRRRPGGPAALARAGRPLRSCAARTDRRRRERCACRVGSADRTSPGQCDGSPPHRPPRLGPGAESLSPRAVAGSRAWIPRLRRPPDARHQPPMARGRPAGRPAVVGRRSAT